MNKLEARQLARIAFMLEQVVPSDHVHYLSKRMASKWVKALILAAGFEPAVGAGDATMREIVYRDPREQVEAIMKSEEESHYRRGCLP